MAMASAPPKTRRTTAERWLNCPRSALSQPVRARPSRTARKATGIRNPADGSDIATKGIAAPNLNDSKDDPAATQGVGPCCTDPDLSKLPPALVLTAGYDPLRDEGADYAKRLTAAGNRASYVCFDRQIHGFITMGRVLDEAHTAVALCAAELKRALNAPG